MGLARQNEPKEENWNECTGCGRKLGKEYPHEYCPQCQERLLFNEVKMYIRENDVRETDVAKHFGIPVHKVRSWIKEGRIQYKGDVITQITGLCCQVCGKPISFGITCPECHSKKDLQVVLQMKKDAEDTSMRFLDRD